MLAKIGTVLIRMHNACLLYVLLSHFNTRQREYECFYDDNDGRMTLVTGMVLAGHREIY